METSEKIDQLIETKSWTDLSVDEKAFVIDILGSQEQYHALREVHFSLLNSERDDGMTLDGKMLNNLRKKFRAKHSSVSFNMFQVRVPAYLTAILIFFAAGVAWYMGAKSVKPFLTTQVIHDVDTLFVASKPDTIYRDKIIYKTVQIKSTPAVAVVSEVQPRSVEVGVNMKETEALQNLLVSGSE
jgi:hypothetical protein